MGTVPSVEVPESSPIYSHIGDDTPPTRWYDGCCYYDRKGAAGGRRGGRTRAITWRASRNT
jgi:hypothetical protein